VPQSEHYCLNGVVVQALNSIQAEEVSGITPVASFFSNFYSVKHVLVMQCSRVVYHGKSHVSISLFTHRPLSEFAYQENTRDKWDIPSYPTINCCIIILYHAVENTVANPINTAPNGKVECNIVEYSTAFLSGADWLYFPLHGINHKYKYSYVLDF